jgi:hypothetical protein
MNQAPLTHPSPRTAPKFRAITYHADTAPEALRATVALIGQGIKDGSKYPPLRDYASRLASRADPKDYLGQVRAIYDDFIKRWRYVKDPLGTELVTISGPAIFDQVIGRAAQAGEHGRGDCDDATVGLASLYRSVGMKTRVVTSHKPVYHLPGRRTLGGREPLFSHVYPQVFVPRVGWVTTDAVGYPVHPMGWTPPYSRQALWDLDANLIAGRGKLPAPFRAMLSTNLSRIRRRAPQHNMRGDEGMSFAGIKDSDFMDYGLDTVGMARTDGSIPEDWSTHGLHGFGAFIDEPVPLINNDHLGLMMEYTPDDYVGYAMDGQPLVRTKMLEMDPVDILHTWRAGAPRLGSVAMADDGDIYQWQETPMGGFFSKIWSGVKSVGKKIAGGVKKAVKFVGSKAKQLISKLPGGKYLIKIYDRVKAVALKLVKPLAKLLGPLAKYASRLAPIAALIPGWGTAAAVILFKVGKITEIVKKFGVKIDPKGRPKFKSGSQAKKFKSALESAAKKEKGKGRKKRGKRRGKRGKKAVPGWLAKRGVKGIEGYGSYYGQN